MMINKKNYNEITNIFVVPHYMGSLRYFDRLFDKLKKEKINIIYIFSQNEFMEQYCKDNNREYEIFGFKKERAVLSFLAAPYRTYKFKKQFGDLIKKYNSKLIIQWNDSSLYNNSIDSAGKQNNISTFLLEWALTLPRRFFLFQKEVRRQIYIHNKSYIRVFYRFVIKEFIKFLNIPLELAFKTYTKVPPSYAAGNSDYLGAFNEYIKQIFINDGIDENKISVLGSFDYDDAFNAKDLPRDELVKKYHLKQTDYYVVYFSCPFYTKDYNIMKLEDQIRYTKKLIDIVDNFFNSKNKKISFIVKLHPAEKIKDYNELENYKNTIVLFKADNNELISLSDFSLINQTSLLESIIAMDKPFIDLSIVDLSKWYIVDGVEVVYKSLGIKETCRNWNDLKESLVKVYDNNFKPINNFIDKGILKDGKCYQRTIDLIKHLIKLTEYRQQYNQLK